MEEIKSNNSDNNPINNSSLKRIGNFIKEARISRNQSIEELSSVLKIGSRQLKAIEEGNEDHLPEKVFIKAMVRRISEKLKVDTEFIMNEFKSDRKEVNIEEIVQEEIVQQVPIQKRKNRKVKNQNSIEVIVFILISSILGLLASSLIFNIFSESSQNQVPKGELINKN